MNTIIGSPEHLVNYCCRVSTEESPEQPFHEWLKRQLLRQAWTQAEFARRLGSDKGVVGNWVRGDRNPNPESSDRIADVLGVDRDLVLALTKHRSPDSDIDLDSNEARLIALVRSIAWDDDRMSLMEGVLRQFRDVDRKKRQ